MAILRMLKGQGARREFILEPDEKGQIGILQIGRDKTKCSLHLESKVVSRTHARIFYKDGAFCLEDLESKAGTVLNGGRLVPHVPRALKHRDLINICDHIFSFLDADGSSDTGSSTDKVTIYEDDPNKTAIHTALDSTVLSMTSRTSANALIEAGCVHAADPGFAQHGIAGSAVGKGVGKSASDVFRGQPRNHPLAGGSSNDPAAVRGPLPHSGR
jgi:pSer/pThr/pTyr-binding forkhead associated (FHA) protein